MHNDDVVMSPMCESLGFPPIVGGISYLASIGVGTKLLPEPLVTLLIYVS